MIERWMLSTLILGVIAALGGTCLTHLCHRLGLPRRWLWLTLMLISIGVPVGLALRHPGAPPPPNGSASIIAPAATAPAAVSSPDSDTILLMSWAIAAIALAGLLATAHRRTLAQLAICPTRTLLGHTVTVSPDFGPAAVGLLHARVVLPEWVFELPPEEQRLVLLHERQHINAGDQYLLLSGVVMIVLMPWNLGLWWQLRRLRVAMELDCDARVAPTSVERPRYGQLLLQARTRQQSYRTALALVPTRSVLAERLHALLESARPSRRKVATWSGTALACALIATRIPIPSLAPGIERPLLRRAASVPDVSRHSAAMVHAADLATIAPTMTGASGRTRAARRIIPPIAISPTGDSTLVPLPLPVIVHRRVADDSSRFNGTSPMDSTAMGRFAMTPRLGGRGGGGGAAFGNGVYRAGPTGTPPDSAKPTNQVVRVPAGMLVRRPPPDSGTDFRL